MSNLILTDGVLRTIGGVAKRRPIQHYDLRDRTTPTAEWPGVEETTTAVGLAGVPAAEEEGAVGAATSAPTTLLPQQQHQIIQHNVPSKNLNARL